MLYFVVILFRKGKLEVKQNGQELTSDKLKSLINQTMQWQTLMVEAVVEVDSRKVKDAKKFYQEFASKPCPSDTAKGVVLEIKEAFRGRLKAINKYTNMAKYPFINVLNEEKEIIENCLSKSSAWYFDSFLSDVAENLLVLEEEVTSPCLNFMETDNQIGKYDEAYYLLESRKSELIDKNETLWMPIRDILDDPNVFRKSDVSKLPGLCATLNQYFSNQLLEEKQKSLEGINTYKAKLSENSNYALLDSKAKDEVEDRINLWIDNLKNATTKDAVGSAMYFGKSNIDAYIENEANRVRKANESSSTTEVKSTKPEKKRTSISSMKVIQQMPEVNTKADLDAFIAKLKAELEKAIDDGFVIGR